MHTLLSYALGGCAAIAFSGAALAQSDAPVSRLDQVIHAGKLRVCMTGDYRPYSLYQADQTFVGIDVDLAQSLARAIGVPVQFVKTSWSALTNDFLQKCDIAMGGVSVNFERLKKVSFSAPHTVDGKSAIARCADVAKFQSLAAMDVPSTRAIVNPGGTNEVFAKAQFKHAQLMMYPDNVTIFDQIIAGKADVMVTDASETLWQAKLHPELCAIHPDQPLQFSEKAFMLPRGDVVLKEFVDTWMHQLKGSGGYAEIWNHWFK